jgi:UDP-2-acetamido-3-amino-2,3-dideoxy-glucuronate N-acetyltransferase
MARICVVGAGRWGQNHVRTLHDLEHLAGLVDANVERLAHFKEQYPYLATYSNVDAAIGDGYDGFTVATPAHTHYSVARKILEAGFPALVEKPLALSSHEARELHLIAKDNNQQLMVGHLLLFHPAIVKMKELIEAGKIGRIQYIYSNRINLGTVRTEENILWSFAPHDISIFQYFLEDRPIEVISRGGAYVQPGIHDSTMTMLTYPGNVMCHNFVSWLHPFKEHRIVVIGSKGMLSFEDSAEHKPLRFYEKGIDWINGEPIKRDGPTEEIEYPDGAPLTEELRYFVNNASGTISRAGAESAVEVLEILEQASAYILDEAEGLSSAAPESGLNIDPGAKLAPGSFVHASSYVDAGARVGAGTKIWHFCHVQGDAEIGEKCSLGQNVNVGNNVKIGNGVKIQNNVSVFEGVELEDGVFCGPSMTFTNVSTPRAQYPVGSDSYGKTLVKEGASIGAKATIVCGHTIGRYAFIAAGAVVTADVPDFAFMAGVPARQIGWAMHGGERVPMDFRGTIVCGRSKHTYRVTDSTFEQLT